MSGRRLHAVAMVALACSYGLAHSTNADEPPRPLAKSIQYDSQQPGTLESALGVRRVSGTIDVARGLGSGRLVVDLYHEGKKVDSHAVGLSVLPHTTETRWDFVVQVIDLDVLRLGDGKPGHSRMILTLKGGNTVASSKKDVNKDVFPTGNSSSVSAFNPNTSAATEAPLCFMILNVRPDENGHVSLNGAVTIKESLQRNPRSDLVIVRFTTDDFDKLR